MDPARWNGMVVVSRGANRTCVRDPGSPAHCLKYVLQPVDAPRSHPAHWLRARLAGTGNANLTELRAWHYVCPRTDASEPWRLAASEAIVETPAGPALRCELVRDEAGDPAPSLHQLLASGIPDADGRMALADAVARFEAWLQRQAIPLFDLNSGNLVRIHCEGRPELVCVDLKSVVARKELLPLSRWSRRLMHAKIARRAARLRSQVLGTQHATRGGTAIARHRTGH